jgi:hypothetical protein
MESQDLLSNEGVNEASPRRYPLWRRLLLWMGGLLVLLAALMAGRCYWVFRDRNPGYTLNLQIDAGPTNVAPAPLRAGFARVKINPDVSNPQQPVWLAGFSQHRAATGIHDDLWALACVMDDGRTRLGIVALDAIGFFHDDVIEVRRRLAADLKLTYAIVCSTHNHSTPDLMGLWGPNFLHTGVDRGYREQVISASAKALGDAVAALQPVRLAYFKIPTFPNGLLTDTRRPEVYDCEIRVLHFLHADRDSTLGSIVSWADHPETVWSHNTEITADYPGYLREVLEKGVTENGTNLDSGVGGMHVFINGAVGGLMSTTPNVIVEDPYLKKQFKEPTHEKAQALGRQLASRILPRLRTPSPTATNQLAIALRARTIELPLNNRMFLLASVLGLLDRGHVRWQTMRSEVALASFGDVSMICIPGEIYPEIVNGGIEKPPGADFGIDPVEVPYLRKLMPGKMKFIIGMANDEIGYIIPKSEWDQKPPYLYDPQKSVYGEINSLGPETGPRIHAAIRDLCQSMTNVISGDAKGIGLGL